MKKEVDEMKASLREDPFLISEDDVDINMDDINVSNHAPIFNSPAAEFASVDEESVMPVDL